MYYYNEFIRISNIPISLKTVYRNQYPVYGNQYQESVLFAFMTSNSLDLHVCSMGIIIEVEMRAVVQRVASARVTIDGNICGEIGRGLLVYIGIGEDDNERIVDWLCNRIVNLRIFNDGGGKKNISVSDIGGGILLISNFTLYGDVKRGFRPSFSHAARPEISRPLYDAMLTRLRDNINLKIESGIFGAMMEVESVNDGPVNIIIEKEA